MMHQLYWICTVKEIVSLAAIMYGYLHELTLYAGVLYMQPSSYSFSSWPHIDITPLGRSVTWLHLFLQQRCFWDRLTLCPYANGKGLVTVYIVIIYLLLNLIIV